MENLQSELHTLTVDNCKLKASLKAAAYEKEKLLELVKNLLTALDNSDRPNDKIRRKPDYQTFDTESRLNKAEENEYKPHRNVIQKEVIENNKYESQENILDYAFEEEMYNTNECKEPSQRKNKANIDEEVKAYDPQAEEVEKRKQMIEIYGEDNWETVLSAETSLQLNFDRFCDKELPQEWPCIPLNLKFD